MPREIQSEAQRAQLSAAIERAPKSLRGYMERAPSSRAAAMKAMCLQCVGWEREEVRACSDGSCPLWSWRPYQ